jgi:CRISPR-associated protein Cas5t
MIEQLTVIKLVLTGAVTSFRYPHFVQGVQPTYEMPPPSTIYGLICAIIGNFEAPGQFEFGIHFRYDAKFRDLEHIHLDVPYRQANPFQRELLFNPRLTLYLAPEHYFPAFEQPFFPLALGRSQDLMSRESLELVTLEQADTAYFEHTLLPSAYAPRFPRTTAATMARFVDRQRRPAWEHYAILKEWVRYPYEEDPYRQTYDPIWVDPTAPVVDGRMRGVVFHRFV